MIKKKYDLLTKFNYRLEKVNKKGNVVTCCENWQQDIQQGFFETKKSKFHVTVFIEVIGSIYSLDYVKREIIKEEKISKTFIALKFES